MPIVVDEVVISVDVDSRGAPGPERPRAAGDAETQALVEACVERVLEILRRREEP